MKATKFFISVLLGFLVFAVSSCNTAEYRPTDGGCDFVIKKIDGKRQWGLVDNWDRKIEFIPCQYDSIFSAYGAPYNIKELFIAVKDGKMYAWNYRGKQLLKGTGFTSLVSSRQKNCHNSSYYGGPLFHEALTPEGIIFFFLPLGEIKWVEYGPAEAMFYSDAYILYKKNRKWEIVDREDNSQIAPPIFDSIMNVGDAYFWVKKDGKWKAIDCTGKVLRKSQSIVNKYLKLQTMSDEQFQKEERTALFRKISLAEVSYIAVDPYNADYIAW